ncbi:MAG: hypothetical protein Q7R30_00135 [Acidobacteriota bacterium]|nr:hypothetical protein [Acidobacteriota bacterium]
MSLIKRQRTLWRAVVSTGVVILALGLVFPQLAAAQTDLKSPKPALDRNGGQIPGHFTVTICRGTPFDMTPINRGRDRYTTPHDVRVTNTTGTSARGGSQGTNGTIRFTSGGPGLPGPLGETTIEYDIIDGSTGAAPIAPAVNTPPQAAPSNPPPAAPPPLATANGTWAPSSCRVASDPGFHDAVLALCRVLSIFIFTEGSITIAHPAPFVTITGDYNTTSGVFTATGRGTVAGFPNVGVRGEGTITASTGQARFNYTLGTGGELPMGQPITYEIVLQKR